MAYDGSLIFDTGIDNGGFEKNAKTLKTQANGLASTFKNLGTAIATAFIARKAFDIGKQAVELASDLQEVQNVVDTAFGDMSYKMEEFAKTSIQSFGISKLTAKQTGSTFMAMAAGMNIADESASNMALSLTGLSADMSSFYNVTQDIASTALKSIFTGETETLKQFGIVMTEANLEAFALSQGITKQVSAMSQAEKVQLRYAFVMAQTAMVQGDFQKTSGSFANQTRILSEQWKELLTVLGQGLVKILLPMVQGLNGLIQGLMSLNTPAKILLGVGVALIAVIPLITLATKGLAIANLFLKGAYAILVPEVITFTSVLKASLGWLGLIISVLGILFAVFGGSANDVSNASTTIADTGDNAFYAADGISDMADSMQNLKNEAKGLAGFDELNTLGQGDNSNSLFTMPDISQLDDVTESLTEIQNILNTPVSGVGIGTDFFSHLTDQEKETLSWWEQVDLELQRRVSETWESIKSGLAGFWEYYKQRAGEVWNDLSALLSLAGNWIYDNVIAKIGGFFSWLWESIKGIFSGIGEYFGSKFSEAWENIKWAFSNVGSFFSGLWDNVKKTTSNAWNGICGLFKNGGEIFAGFAGGVGDVFKNIVNAITGGINQAISSALGALNGFLNKIRSFSIFGQQPFINMWGANPIPIPKIPKLATGTVVPANAGEFMAILGDNRREPEVVSPLSTMKQAVKEVLSEIGGIGGNQNVTVVLDGVKVSRELTPYMQKESRRLGNSIVTVV